jgi:hypothetical protein
VRQEGLGKLKKPNELIGNRTCDLLASSIVSQPITLQKERPLHGDLFPVNQVFNMTTITSGNFFNTNCDVVDYSVAHILSYLMAGLHD